MILLCPVYAREISFLRDAISPQQALREGLYSDRWLQDDLMACETWEFLLMGKDAQLLVSFAAMIPVPLPSKDHRTITPLLREWTRWGNRQSNVSTLSQFSLA